MRINNVPHIRNIEAVHSLKPVEKIRNITDFKYKLERNELNNEIYLYNMKLKLRNNNTNELSNKRNIEAVAPSYHVKSENITKDKERLSAYGNLIFRAQARKQLEDFKSPSIYNIQNLLRRCRCEILGFDSKSFLLNASYLLSPVAVIALLNFKDEDA